MRSTTKKTAAADEDQFRVIFESVSDGIFVCDAATGAFVDEIGRASCRERV